ncbi:Hypothetical protein R9X50_00346400 [Acrodontium crateriforme]|uniref:Uncharacterized protein n=1 Tax=Acrodontium crateriforme TaxID=150365 RepID=A0AAQ3M2Z3_9PEZI|nr:Hypothetical protein R9X50_00346400 [Acrodontium crateriforme]
MASPTNDESDVSLQLYSEIHSSLLNSIATRRPILTHLNLDTSWFLQIPRPASAVKRTGRAYYNILIDPWFKGGQSDVASWFSQQFHATPSAVQSILELEDLARESERLAWEERTGGEGMRPGHLEDDGECETLIDAVAVSHEFTDHCHKDTLLEVSPNVPVFAIKEAAALITTWKHFHTVVTVNAFGTEGNEDWRATSLPPLPDWIGISRLLQTDDVLNYHAALLITFNNGHSNHQTPKPTPLSSKKPQPKKRPHNAIIETDETTDSAEAILYTPHGIHADDLTSIPSANPPLKTLAFLHGLHNVRVGTASGRTALQSNLGAHNGLKAQRLLKAKYWIGTHDEVKQGGGIVAFFLQRDVLTIKDALELEAKNRAQGDEGVKAELEQVLDSFEGTNWIDLGNGESRVLV